MPLLVPDNKPIRSAILLKWFSIVSGFLTNPSDFDLSLARLAFAFLKGKRFAKKMLIFCCSELVSVRRTTKYEICSA